MSQVSTSRHREAFLKPQHSSPHRLTRRPVPRLEDLIKTSLKACESHSVRITAASHTLEHAFVDWSENLNELEKTELKAKAAVDGDLQEALEFLQAQEAVAFKHEKELRQAEGSLQDMERYLEQREKWTKMDRVIAEKQRQREEDIKVNALKLKRFKERRRKRLTYAAVAFLVCFLALLLSWTIQESRHPTIPQPPPLT
ncbi:hypothetical protein BDY24DRAFT_413997 [Mrakia frigida]|uniref:uncharacterized protein n=1 Tax=Mrakia frigida TaxID=29902 RepID=UPI003FCBF34E